MIDWLKKVQSPVINFMLCNDIIIPQGWGLCQSCDMNTFFNSLTAEERWRIDNLELFDEYEEWHLKCSHYIILCAFNGSCGSLANQILPYSSISRLSLQRIYGDCTLDDISWRSSCLKRLN